MARRRRRREPVGKGRTTPKGTPPRGRAAPASDRYTPPVPREQKVSPPWVPALMFTLLIGGAAVIVANYLNLLPGDADNVYLLIGLGLITAGFVAATQYH